MNFIMIKMINNNRFHRQRHARHFLNKSQFIVYQLLRQSVQIFQQFQLIVTEDRKIAGS